MTESELQEMKRLWDAGVKIKDISARLKYTQSYIRRVAWSDRERFPKRRVYRVDRKRMAEWVTRILDGTATEDEAAKDLGCHVETVRTYVRVRQKGGLIWASQNG